MSGPKWADVERLYHAALALETGRRPAFLAEACGGDQELLGEVESLIKYEEKGREFIEPPTETADGEHARLLRAVRRLHSSETSGRFIGRSFGVYDVHELIAYGGMGEVYRAVDRRLNRTVVIKTLPAHLSGDPERQERFKREAKIISELNHPHICMLYDIGRQDDVDYLVLEYLEGETLQTRLSQRQLSVPDALEFAIQIADSLRAAHRRGIIHRDLKPANIMLTSTGIKLLDFGVAVRSTPPNIGLETTELNNARRLTVDGTILGTPQYISPEQLEGKPADARTDIFSFGAVTYEMFTGKRAFIAESAAGLISAILKDEPQPMNEGSSDIPTPLMRSILRCLAKNPDDRWQTADDLLFQLRSLAQLQNGAEVSRTKRWRMTRSLERALWALVLVAMIVAALFAVRTSHVQISAPPKIPPIRFALVPPQGTAFYSGFDVSFALSADGRNLVFVAQKEDGTKQLWLRSLYSGSERPLTGSEGASMPFWSPDGEWVGFFSADTLKKVRVSSGLVQTVANAVQPFGGAAWSTSDVILFPVGPRGLSRVSAKGGPVTAAPSGEGAHFWPQFLGDGDHFIYVNPAPATICLGSLKNDPHRVLMRFPVRISAVAYVLGYILFVKDAVLYARPFDEKTLEFTGEPAKILDRIPVTPTGRAPFAASATGVLAYREYPIAPPAELQWVASNGRERTTAVAAAQYLGFTLSPDSRRVIFSRIDATGSADLWERNLNSGTERQLTFDGSAFTPQWSPDGTRVAFTGTAEIPPPKLFIKELANGKALRRVSSSTDKSNWASSWSSNHAIVSVRIDPVSGRDLWIQNLQDGSESPLIVNTVHQEYEAKVSPDGRWIAYVTDAFGRDEVWVARFPSAEVRRRVSAGSGTSPQWNNNGKELFYIADESNLNSVPFSPSESDFRTGAPRAVALLKDIVEPDRLRFPTLNRYVVDPNGGRFLVATRAPQVNAPPINIIVNWPALMQR
jgi:serine/threonine protein kinase/Tol biopolymer transport system component